MSPESNHYFTSPTKPPKKLKKMFVSVAGQPLSLQTTPQVFCPDGIDKGTELLLENLLVPAVDQTQAILDLGAGYGPDRKSVV